MGNGLTTKSDSGRYRYDDWNSVDFDNEESISWAIRFWFRDRALDKISTMPKKYEYMFFITNFQSIS